MNFGGLKVLMISSDRNIFSPKSAVSGRMAEYGALVEELHIVVLSDKSHNLKEMKISNNVFVYPTNSMFSITRPIDAARMGKRIVLKNKFVRGLSIITADSMECGWAAMKIKRRWKVPFEVQIHSDPFSPFYRGFQNIVRKFYMKKILRSANSVRVMSEELRLKIIQKGLNSTVSVLPIYIDKEKIEKQNVTFDVHSKYPWHFIILVVARLEKEKNIPLALKILGLVRKDHPEVGMIVVGSGSLLVDLKSLAQKLNVDHGVEFVGWQEDLSSFYKTSNIFLQTSLFEGYGMALVEAGLNKLPVVTTPVGITSELENGKDALIYNPADAEMFAAGIIELLENNFKRENLIINLKNKLESMLLSKGQYLEKIKTSWEETSKQIR